MKLGLTKLHLKKYGHQAIFQLARKKIDNNLEIIVDKITKTYNIGNKIYKTNREDIVIPKVGYSKAIKVF